MRSASAPPHATPVTPVFFAEAAEFRAWLHEHHATHAELWVGFHKKRSGRGGLSYADAVLEALCYGWIDGRLQPIDAHAYQQRFTPRRRGSIWSLVNVRHVQRLTAAGRMHPAGLAAFAARTAERTGVYSFERKKAAALPTAYARRFRAVPAAWAFFTAQPPGYQRAAIHKVVSPKQAVTRERWLERLIRDSAAGKRLEALRRPEPRTDSPAAPRKRSSRGPGTSAVRRRH